METTRICRYKYWYINIYGGSFIKNIKDYMLILGHKDNK